MLIIVGGYFAYENLAQRYYFLCKLPRIYPPPILR